MLKVNLGCGPSGIEGWLNYDWGILALLSKFAGFRRWLVKLRLLSKNYEIDWPKLRLWDIRWNLLLKSNSVDFIYCSHVLEHMEYWQSKNILKECKRVLKKNGILRIVIPDLKRVISKYLKNKDAKEFNIGVFGVDRSKKDGGFFGKLQRFFIREHKWMYDEKELIFLLKKAGFRKIRKCNFRKGVVPDVDKLDLKIHKELSMYFEVKK
ncbi:methyltransferase domain-containing protein [Patescibacteria group bacterium]|nr:methyltransferase domain-containing protein [Patescibacteria group bacterium]